MKRIATVLLAVLMLMLSACAKDKTETVNTENYSLDYDLTAVSDTVMVSQIINLIYAPDLYKNKFFRIKGTFDQLAIENSEEKMSFIVIYDEAGCCPYGIEIRLDENTQVPELMSEITIEALSLVENGNTYLQVLKLEL